MEIIVGVLCIALFGIRPMQSYFRNIQIVACDCSKMKSCNQVNDHSFS